MLLIDTYNVLQTTGVLPPDLAGPELADLGRLLASSRYSGRQIMLVCDGGRHHAMDALAIDGLAAQVIMSGPGQDADRVLEGLIDGDTSPGRLLVVSTDRRVQRAASRRGAAVLGSEPFLRQLVADRLRGRAGPVKPRFASELPLDRAGTEYWLRYFDEGAGQGIGRQPANEPPVKAEKPPRPEPAPRRAVRAAVGESLGLPKVADRTGVLWPKAGAADDGGVGGPTRPLEGDLPPLDMDHWLRLFPPTDAEIRKARGSLGSR